MTFLSIFTFKFQVGVAYMSELLARHLTNYLRCKIITPGAYGSFYL